MGKKMHINLQGYIKHQVQDSSLCFLNVFSFLCKSRQGCGLCDQIGQFSVIMVSVETVGKQWKQCQTLFFWAPKSLQMVIAAMKLKDATPWEESYDQHRLHIKKQRHYLANKGPSSQGYSFSSGHVWM